MRIRSALVSPHFLMIFSAVFLASSALFAWELAILPLPFLPLLPRPPASNIDLLFSGLISLFLAFDVALATWRIKDGSCPIGVRRATGTAGVLAAMSLLCPLCMALPVGILGASIPLSLLSPFVPILRFITLALLGFTAYLLMKK